MNRTSPLALVLLGVVGAVVAGVLQFALVAGGRPILVPPVTLPVGVVAIGVILIALAVPIRRMTRGTISAPVDPFYATRVVTLAKAAALGGALLTGAGAALVISILTRPLLPAVGSIAVTVASAIAAGILLACGLIAEYMCRIPPSDDDEDDGEKPIRVER